MTKFFICTVVVFAAIIMYTVAAVPGGLGDSKPVDAKVTALINRQRASIIEKICDNAKKKRCGCGGSPSNCPTANAIIVINSYKTQVVAGTNYFVSLTINGTIYHVRIFVPLRGETEVVTVQGPKKASDEVSYF